VGTALFRVSLPRVVNPLPSSPSSSFSPFPSGRVRARLSVSERSRGGSDRESPRVTGSRRVLDASLDAAFCVRRSTEESPIKWTAIRREREQRETQTRDTPSRSTYRLRLICDRLIAVIRRPDLHALPLVHVHGGRGAGGGGRGGWGGRWESVTPCRG
jgi:hypothetical protein